MNLRTKFFVWISALLTCSFVGVGALMMYSERQAIVAEMEGRHRQLAASLKHICEESLYKSEELAFLNYVTTLKTERGFIGAAFVEHSGRVRMHSDAGEIGRLVSSPKEAEMSRFAADCLVQRYQRASGEETLDLAYPVFFSGERVGTARLFLSQKTLDEFLNQSAMTALKRILLILFLSLTAAFIGAFWLARTLVSPIQLVIRGMEDVSKGRLDPILFPKQRNEIGRMGEQINSTILKLKELDQMKRDFVAAVTHDLRSPLSAIDSLIRHIHSRGVDATDEERNDFLLTALNNTTRLSKMVDNLLTAAKIEAGKTELSIRRFDLRDVLQEVVQLYRPLAREKELELSVQLGKAPVPVLADPDKVVQIVHNLMSNAFKYTSQGYVKMSLSNGGPHVTVSIEDSGRGIPENDKSRLFEKFFRTSRSAKVNGTGLGLYITKTLVEAQNGRISMKANPKGGSIFSIALPCGSEGEGIS